MLVLFLAEVLFRKFRDQQASRGKSKGGSCGGSHTRVKENPVETKKAAPSMRDWGCSGSDNIETLIFLRNAPQ